MTWNANALKTFGRRARVFCASMADVMDDEAPAGQRERLWRLIDQTPNLLWLLLTKRPQRYGRYLPGAFRHRNVWLGFTAESQQFYDNRWPIVRELAARRPEFVTWCSYEPALGPVSLGHDGVGAPDWMIFGGETGHHRRPCEAIWAEDLAAQCRDRGVKFFMKQMSARTPTQAKDLIPARLMIHEFPTGSQ